MDTKNSILIVDDEAINITALSHILSQDYTLYIAKDGNDALEAAFELNPDLILLDIIMPNMTGYEVITRLKKSDKTREIPVIFITGLSNQADEERGLAMGASDYINKPFSADIVRLRVHNQIKIVNQLRMIHHLSITDELTKASNRRNFNQRMDDEWKRAIRDSAPLSILMLDVDNFKNYNATYGHLQGDVALQAVVVALKEKCKRATDLVARWGGEEFAVILPGTDMKGAQNLAEEVRNDVEAQILDFDGKPTHITVSIGVNSITPDANASMNDFVADADRALYSAKENGKNRVCMAEISTSR